MIITNESLLEYMLEVSQEAAYELISIRDKTPKSKLIQPLKRNKTMRLSEQELRMACINAIQKDNINYLKAYFSIETPTEKTYKQKGKGYRSGRSDISLYQRSEENFTKICNIELKEKNCGIGGIYKDMEKLIKEDIVGGWFHILRNTNSGTYATLFSKFSEAIANVVSKHVPKFPILFTFFDLNNGELIIRKVQPHELLDPNSVFKISYKALRAAKNRDCVDGWMVFK